MSDSVKKIFFGAMVILPFIVYSIYYYTPIIRNAPYKSTDFQSFQMEWGKPNHLNSYDSNSGLYRFYTKNDSLIQKHVKFKSDDMLYLHRKMNEVGLWNCPDLLVNRGIDTAKISNEILKIKFVYKEKVKTIFYDATYDENESNSESVENVFKIIHQSINDAMDRYQVK